MSRKSTQVALGGVCTSLCVLLMFATSMVPFATYAIPMLAGALLIPVIIENGTKTAVLVYAAVSILSFFVVPDREAAIYFIAFLGYYPIAKTSLDRIRPRFLSVLAKFALFNVAITCATLASIYLLGMGTLVEDMGDFGRYGALVMLGLGNVFFVAYDFCLSRYLLIYIRWFRPRFLRRT